MVIHSSHEIRCRGGVGDGLYLPRVHNTCAQTLERTCQVVGFNVDTSQKFKMYEDLTRARLTRFAEGIIDGR